MSRRRKRLDELLRRPARMRFQDVEAILLNFGFRERPNRAGSSHVFFSKQGVGYIPIPKDKGRWVNDVYLDQVRKLLRLDELDLDELDAALGPEQ